MAKSTGEPMEQLRDASMELMKTIGDRALGTFSDKVGGLTDKLENIADGGPLGKAAGEGAKSAAEGGSPIAGALKGAVSGIKDKVTGGGGGSGGGSKATKSTNIVESIDVGVPVSVAYNQWTEFGAFPTFMKKVEKVEAEEDNKLEFKAQIFLSHRTWEATILEQIPDERIVWRSKGEKGHVDGAVTFHELGSNLTRILVVLEYYPQGLFEKTGNLWRAQGRRARAELRHFRRHVMTRSILEPDEIEGWRGVIEDGEVVKTHEEALEEEQYDEGEDADQDEDEGFDDQSEEDANEDDEDDPDEEDDDEEPEDEYEDSDQAEDDEADEADGDAEDPDDGDEEPEDEYAEDEDADGDEPEAEEEPEDEYDEAEDEPEDEPEDEDEVPEEEDLEDDESDDEALEDEEPDDEAEGEDEGEEPEGEEPEEEPERRPRRRRGA